MIDKVPLLVFLLLAGLGGCANAPSIPPVTTWFGNAGPVEELPKPEIPPGNTLADIPYSPETAVNPQEIDPDSLMQQQQVVSEVKTRIGNRFFKKFHLLWQVNAPDWKHPIVVEEKPAMGSGYAVIITVSTQNQMIWGKVIKPRPKVIEEAAQEAAKTVKQVVIKHTTR